MHSGMMEHIGFSSKSLVFRMKRILVNSGSVVSNLHMYLYEMQILYFIRDKTFDRAIIFFALRSTMLHLVHLLLTPRKFDIFGCRQIRRDLVATVSSKVGRLPLPDIISTNVPRS